jgi:hypothetical protein
MYGVNVAKDDEYDADVTPRLHVSSEAVGTGAPPWERDAIVDEYRVAVDIRRDGETQSYVTQAWGSIHNHAEGILDAEGIAWMVLDELHSAMVDPDEFAAMALPSADAEGQSAQRLRLILAVLDFAQFAEPELTEAEDIIRQHN